MLLGDHFSPAEAERKTGVMLSKKMNLEKSEILGDIGESPYLMVQLR